LRAAAWVVCTVRMVPHGTIRTVHSGSQDHHPSKNSVQKTICCNSTSNAPDDGRRYPKHVELRIHKKNYLAASSWPFTLFYNLPVCLSHPNTASISVLSRECQTLSSDHSKHFMFGGRVERYTICAKEEHFSRERHVTFRTQFLVSVVSTVSWGA